MSKDVQEQNFAGIRFSLDPQTDDFADIILSALDEIDTSNVWSKTDATSTVYRGEKAAVFDTVKAAFVHTYRKDVHGKTTLTISQGCGSDEDAAEYKHLSDERINDAKSSDRDFDIIGKFQLYPMGVTDYNDTIYEIVEEAKKRDIYEGTQYYTTFLMGSVHDIFDYLEYVSNETKKITGHHVIEAQLSFNIPEEEAELVKKYGIDYQARG
jgi:uncharacterized protein YqgV (UPF0045/DUF77 family)